MKKILTKNFIRSVIRISVLALPVFSNAQVQKETELISATVTMAANTKYNEAGKIKQIMLGDHYRKVWATPVEIRVLDMNAFAGGLTPVKAGGGLQTKSLRLTGKNGKEYVLRTINKDVTKAMSAELRKTFAQDIVQDQISSANPYAPLVVASLAEVAGIYHSTPQIVYVEKSARLGEFSETFGETICLLEERPAGNEENNPAYGYSKKIVNTAKLFEKVFNESDQQVDEKSFLKARLFDLLIGDWDRHEDQWLWASFKEDGKTIYKPIPRDRDQAFSKMDGVIPTMATRKWALRKVQNFDFTIRDVNGLGASGGYLDRNFTTRLGLQDWLAVANELQQSLTDEAIETAFREMPEPIYNLSARETISKLKKRRDDLQKYAKSYYAFLSAQVNITGTNEKEYFEITRLNNDSTSIAVYHIGKNDNRKEKIYNRIFLYSETKEIRLYGLDGNDVYHIKGNVKKGILVRAIGGKGEDVFIDSSSVKGIEHETKIYDDGNNIFMTGRETRKVISTDSLKNGYNRKAYVFDWLAPVMTPGYNADDGFLVGGSLIYKKQQFGKSPYGQMHTLAANYAFATGAYSMSYKGVFKEFINKSDLQIGVKYHSPSYTRNFYGLGNETIKNEEADKDFYRLRMSQLSISSMLVRQLGNKHTLSLGSEFQTVHLQDSDGRYVTTTDAKLDSSDFERKKFANFQMNYQFNTLDNSFYPRKGIKLDAGARYTQNIADREKHFIQLHTEASAYFSAGRLTAIGRLGAATNIWDEYEFYQAPTLGGMTNLRGYHRDRFAGKTSAYNNTELRFSVSNLNAYLFKGTWGLLAFADHGRVWMPDENSDVWHHGYGGGLWFLPFNKIAFTATYGISKEDKLVNIKAGFLF